MITPETYYMGRDKQYPEELTQDKRNNAIITLTRCNSLTAKYCEATGAATPGLRSGWRPYSVNLRVDGAPRSRHLTCQAIDLSDPGHKFSTWCLSNLEELEAHGLYMEAPEHTPSWCHLQTVAPRSGHRVFIP